MWRLPGESPKFPGEQIITFLDPNCITKSREAVAIPREFSKGPEWNLAVREPGGFAAGTRTHRGADSLKMPNV